MRLAQKTRGPRVRQTVRKPNIYRNPYGIVVKGDGWETRPQERRGRARTREGTFISSKSDSLSEQTADIPTCEAAGGRSDSVNKSGRRPDLASRATGLFVILLLLVPTLVIADGMAFVYTPTSSLEPLAVNEQRAIIAHKDGIQRMFITINLGDRWSADEASRSAVWIFPVPGKPDRADVEVTDFSPELTGDDVERAFRNATDAALLIPMASQPHFVAVVLPVLFGAHGTRFLGRMPEGAPGVTTHKTVNRWGIHAELITADSVERLADYLHAKNVKVAPGRLSPFAPYLSDEYALVVAWISSYKELIKKFPQLTGKQGMRRPALYVEFPTDKPFYPMRPTSGYGKKSIKVSLYLVGWVSPDRSDWTAAEKKAMSPRVTYCAGKSQKLNKGYRSFLSVRDKDAERTAEKRVTGGRRRVMERFLAVLPKDEVRFTRVRIRRPAENFTRDFRFSRNSRVYIMHSITSSPWALASVVIVLLAVLSFVSGGISGKLVFGKWKPWSRMGLWNCLTIAALVAATWWSRRDPDPDSPKATVSARWEAFVFGFLVCLPLLVLFCRPIAVPGLYNTILWLLAWIFSAALLLIAAWIVSNPGSTPSTGKDTNADAKKALVPTGIPESFVRVVLMCLPALAIGTTFFLVFWFLKPAARSVPYLPMILAFYLGQFVLYCTLIAAGLFLVPWIVRKGRSAWRPKREANRGSETEPFSSQKPEALILGALTFVVVALVVLSIPNLPEHGGLVRIAYLGVITVELFLATWVVWKGASNSISTEDRFSPAWPLWIAVLLMLLPLMGLLIYVAALQLGGGPTVFLAGVIMLVALRHRMRIASLIKEMTYKTAVSTVFVVLGVLSYFFLIARAASALVPVLPMIPRVAGRDVFAIFALLSATWLLKGELQKRPTKALRFGVLFSVVFTLLNVAAFFGVKALLASL